MASAAQLAAADSRVEKACIWTVDKDLAQCVTGERVVQMERKSGKILDAGAVRAKFGVPPALIPDYLAIVGDSADGYPGLPGWGPKTAVRLLERHGPLESFPDEVLGKHREHALLFKRLATLRRDAPLFEDVEELRWRGPTPAFDAIVEEIGDSRLRERAAALASRASSA